MAANALVLYLPLHRFFLFLDCSESARTCHVFVLSMVAESCLGFLCARMGSSAFCVSGYGGAIFPTVALCFLFSILVENHCAPRHTYINKSPNSKMKIRAAKHA
jgi:hypothetical protein